MCQDYNQYIQELSQHIGRMKEEAPCVMKNFSLLARSATQEGTLDATIKELIALSISVSKRCKGCIGFHVRKLVELNASREEIIEALGVCVYMGGSPSLMHAVEALKAYDQMEKH